MCSGEEVKNIKRYGKAHSSFSTSTCKLTIYPLSHPSHPHVIELFVYGPSVLSLA